jgi:hypothetical protein
MVLEKRMYGLVPYNISPIQQGIQFGHAVVNYELIYGKKKKYVDWANNWKTFIILNGGTTNKNDNNNPFFGSIRGTLNKHRDLLVENKIPTAAFYEPDLGDQLTAVVFIVDERVFKAEEHPNVKDEKVLFLREFLKQFKLA